MQRINSARMSPFTLLPHDLKVLIFEFLPLQNYYPLQLTCRNFYYILLTTPRLWAKHMFSYFLNHTICEDPFLTHDPFEEKFHISADHIKYELMTNSKTILETHYKLKNKWENFFSLFLASVNSQELVHGIFESLRSPTFPEPSLKKNIHVFTTNTFFQNFLTEVRFGLQGKSFMTDRKQAMVQNVTESLRLSLSKGGLDTDKLISLRWYFFNTSSANKRVNRNSNISNAHLAGEKRISKVKTFLRDGRLVTVADRSFENEQLRSNSKYKGFFSNQARWEAKFTSPRNMGKPTLKDERESESVFTDHDGIDGYNTSLEEFYRLIHALMKNYCVMIFTYLKTIQDNQSILMEYIRLWDQYVLTMIELNQVLAPFSDLLNEVYNRNCEGLVNFPEFSIWRVMTKLWLNDVFTPLVSFFQKAFFSILMSVRIQDTFFKFNTLQLEKALSHLNQKPEEGSVSLKRMLSNKFSDAFNLEGLEQRGEQSHNLIRQFYQAVSDLSYDEFTIFYLHCITPNPQTPEGIWNTAIVNNSEMIYGFWKELLLYDPNYIVSTFQKDLELVESFFGKALTCQLKEKQMLILKDLLSEVFYAAVNEYDANRYGFNEGNVMQVENDPNKFSNITFGNIVMHLKPDEDIRKKVIEDSKCKDGVARILNKNCPKFTALLNLLIDVKQTLDHQQRELEETYNERYQRGFPLIDEQYESFFSLNRNPSSRFVKGLPEGFSGGRSLSYTGGHDGLDKILL